MKKSIKYLVTAVALTAGVLAFSKTDSKAAVTNVKQTDAGETSVSLQWDTELKAESYVIQFSKDGNTNWTSMERTTTTSDNVNNLTAGSTYYVRVGAFSEYIYESDFSNLPETMSGWSDPIEVVTAPNVDKATLIQVGATKTSITMKCSEVQGANLYQLSNGAYNEFAAIGESEKNIITSSKDVQLTAGTSYTIHCYPCRVAASTGFIARHDYVSKWGTKTLTDKVSDNNFGFINIWSNIDSYTVGILSRDAVGVFDGIQVQLQTPAGKVVKTMSGSGDSISMNQVNGGFYRYRLRTYIDCGTEGNVYSQWTTGYHYFGIPKKISYTSSKSKIKINWSKVTNASDYNVYISTNENSGYKKVKTVSNKTRNITIKKCGKNKLKAGKRYYIKISSNAKVGKKTYKSEVVSIAYCYVSKY